MDHERYRADIDGLRAIAVLSVLFFHVDIEAFKGGYVGVDIFFVISGFLITKLIRDEVLRSGHFSFANFYLRRARRLLPVFFFTLALCFVIAFFLYPPPQMEGFGKSMLYSVLSGANILFWQQSGYFDTTSVYKPLLHIWSLSVEEQFYMVWPLLLTFLLFKTPRRLVPAALVLLFSGSFYLNFEFADGQVSFLADHWVAASTWFADGRASIFYFMPFRVFEFAIGALLVWLAGYRPKNQMFLEFSVLIGFVLIFIPIFTYSEETLFPSYNALMPCFGAALLIYGGESRYLGSVLGARWLVWIGRISYSLYLIHWPAVVFYKYYAFDFGALSIIEQSAVCVFSVFAAALMYTYIEQPFRKGAGSAKAIPTRPFLVIGGVVGVLLLSLSAGAWVSDGWKWRMPNAMTQEEIDRGIIQNTALTNISCDILKLKASNCRPDAPMQVLFLGDSHSYVGYNMFAESFGSQEDVNLVHFSVINQCDFTVQDGALKALGMGWQNQGKCQERADVLNDPAVNASLDVLVISSQYVFQMGAEIPIIDYLRSKNEQLQIVLIGPYLDVRPYLCSDIINRFGSSAYCKDERFVGYFGGDLTNDKFYDDYMKYAPLYIDTVDLLCDQGKLEGCVTEVAGVPMFYDGDHPSLEFSLLMGRRMVEEYSSELESIGFVPSSENEIFPIIENPNGLENLDGKLFFWMGDQPTVIKIFSSSAGQVRITGNFIGGASLTGIPGRRVSVQTDAGYYAEVDVIETPSFTVPVGLGNNEIIFTSLDRPTVLKQPNGDTRILLVGVSDLKVFFNAGP